MLGPLEGANGYKVGGMMGRRGVATIAPADGPAYIAGTFLACSCGFRP